MPTEKIQIIVEGRDSGGTSVLGNLKNALGGVATVAGGILAANLFGKITEGISSVGRTAIDAVGHAQTLEMQLEGLLAMNNMYTRQGKEIVATGLDFAQSMDMAKEQAQDLLGFVEKLAVVSPFETRQVEEVTRIGLAADMSTGMVKDFTRAFLDYSATVGIGSQDLAFAADQFLQLRKIGKLTTIDLRQLRRLGIDVEKILGAKMGMSVEQFNDQVEKSPELMDELFKSFIEFSGEVSAGAAERMTQTLPGMMSTARDLIEVGSKNLFRPMIEAISPTMSDLLGRISDFVTGPQIRVIGNLLGGAITGALTGDLKWAIANLGGILATLGMDPEKVTAATNALEGMVGTVQNLIGAFREGGLGGLAGALGITPESLGSAWQSAMTGLLDLIVQSWPQVQETLTTLGGQFWSWLGTDVIPAANTALDSLVSSIVAWSSNPETQAQVSSLGESLGGMLVNGISESPALVGLGWKIVSKLFEISLDLTGAMNNLGSSLADGIAGGIIDSLGLEGTSAAIAAGLQAALAKAVQLVNPIAFITSTLSESFGNIKAAGEALNIPGFQGGGVVPGAPGQPQLAVVHGGERIIDPHSDGGGGGHMTVDVPIVLQIDGEVIARVLGQRVARLQRMGGTARL